MPVRGSEAPPEPPRDATHGAPTGRPFVARRLHWSLRETPLTPSARG
ncbi:hypothetical protein D516_2401 [Rhodobacter sp. AKP1]|nr:hypothetical protein D516_2401 [Rhodobacter sp. AKP1]